MERWKPIPGYDGTYEVSNLGNIRSLDRIDARGSWRSGVVLKPGINPGGRRIVCLHKDGVQRTFKVQRLVLLAFVGPPPAGADSCHNDGDVTNNTLDNLRWDTRSENIRDQVRHGTHLQARKTHCIRGHAYDEANTYELATKTGGKERYCRTCRTALAQARYKRRRERQAAAAASR